MASDKAMERKVSEVFFLVVRKAWGVLDLKIHARRSEVFSMNAKATESKVESNDKGES